MQREAVHLAALISCLASANNMETISMDIGVKRILILILALLGMTRVSFTLNLENGIIQKEAMFLDECDLILVSHSRIDKGKRYYHSQTP